MSDQQHETTDAAWLAATRDTVAGYRQMIEAAIDQDLKSTLRARGRPRKKPKGKTSEKEA